MSGGGKLPLIPGLLYNRNFFVCGISSVRLVDLFRAQLKNLFQSGTLELLIIYHIFGDIAQCQGIFFLLSLTKQQDSSHDS